MSTGIDSRVATGFIGYCCTRAEMLLTKKLLRGIPLKITKRYDRDDRRQVYAYSFWTSPDYVLQARDARRGFKAALQLQDVNSPYGFMIGVAAGLQLRKGKHGNVSRRAVLPELQSPHRAARKKLHDKARHELAPESALHLLP